MTLSSDSVETALSADLSRALSELDSPEPERLPELDLDSASLPRLDDFASVEEALSCSLGDLTTLDAVLPSHMSLSDTLSPAHSPRPTPSNSSISSDSFGSPADSPSPMKPKCCPDVHAALSEVSQRLKSAAAESAALRQRVAELVSENRTLRKNLEQSRAQTAAAQAASKVGANPMLLGLAHVSAEVAAGIAAALTPPQPQPVGKKRKRAAAGKTLACLVLMCGFFFGTPSVLDGTERTDANLPAVWRSRANNGGAPLVRSKVTAPPVRASHCLRSLEQLPPPPELAAVAPPVEDTTVKKEKVVVKKEVVEEEDIHAVERQERREQNSQFSYVMCRNTSAAVEHASECSRRQSVGKKCGSPQTISLIMPASALSADETAVNGDGDYAEVLCSIMSVARIPADAATGKQAASGVAAAQEAMNVRDRTVGRIIASVAEGNGVVS